VLGKPFSLMVEPTNACNLRCPLCPTGRGALGRETAFLPLDVFRQCIDQLGPYLLDVNLANYGEPMLHRDLPRMIAYAKAAGARVSVASNGQLLNEESSRKLIESGLDRIYISFDGTDQATYESYRVGGEFARVVQGVKTLLAARAELGRENPRVELQFLVMKHNERQIDAFREVADSLGVDRRIIKPVSFNVADWDDEDTLRTFEDFVPESEEYRVYRRDGDGGWWWKTETLDFCTAPWRVLVVLADGSIVPCCRDPRGKYTMGNVADGALEVWNNDRYRAFRRALIERREKVPICNVCPGE
jgi:radical SAM protein with 4Fe4S-binding SPASM domain